MTHRTIAAVTEALDSFAFNVAVARLYELANAIADAERSRCGRVSAAARREAVEMLARLIAPMMPHLAEEVYRRTASRTPRRLVAELPWPEADPDLLAAETVTIAVQVMGKLRGTIAVPPDAPARRRDRRGRRPSRTSPARWRASGSSSEIHVPNRIVNFVVAG